MAAAAGGSWYTELDFDSYVLDILLLGWCGAAAAVYMAVNSIKDALGPVARQPAAERTRIPIAGALAGVLARTGQAESCQWLNTALQWLYSHYYNSPNYMDEWVKSLNQQLTKLGGPVQNKVEKIQPSIVPPKILSVVCQTPPDGSVILLTKMAAQDLTLSLFTSQQTSEGVRLTNCAAHIHKLNGQLRIKIYREKKDVKVRASFDSRPEIKVEVKPTNPCQDAGDLVDLGVVERNVRNALGLADTVITITKLLMVGDLSTIPGHCPDEDAAPAKPGEIRVRASDAGWGMSASDIALLNQRFSAQRLQNKMAKLAAFNQPSPLAQGSPMVQPVTPQSRPLSHDSLMASSIAEHAAESMSPGPHLSPQTLVSAGKGPTPKTNVQQGVGIAPMAGAGGL